MTIRLSIVPPTIAAPKNPPKSMVNLSVHKNTLARRKRRTLRRDLEHDARVLARQSPISSKIVGYTIVVWNEDLDADACWTGGNLPASMISEFAKQTIVRKLSMLDANK